LLDSKAIKRLTFLAFIFLPPTLVTGVFSTSFFKMSDDGRNLKVSSWFWVYWVFVLCFAAPGLVWSYLRGVKHRKVDRTEKSNV
jgi:Mg2+ and Co2+ transporter CorA